MVVELAPLLTAVTFHEPTAEVTEPVAPVTAYPLQFVLDQLLSLTRMMPIPGGIERAGVAIAGLRAAKSISEPTRSIDNLFIFFIQNTFED